jgi:hypothetical protein
MDNEYQSSVYFKEVSRACDYSQILKITNGDGDDVLFKFKEESDKAFSPDLILSQDDLKALIKMLKEFVKE